MSFCDDCGILLPDDSSFSGKGCLCRACTRSKSFQNQGKCNCEFCYFEGSGGFSNTIINDVHPKDALQCKSRSRSRSSPKSSHPQEDHYQMEVDHSFNFEYGGDYNWICGDKGMALDTTMEWNLLPECGNVQETKKVDAGRDNKTEEDTWMVCTRKHAVKERKEDQVSEEIAYQWAEEQAQLLKKLLERDTPNIANLTSGKRRKEDRSRFYIGGVDISFFKDNKVEAVACLSVVQMPSLELVYQRMEIVQLTQPYIPGFLAFREVPPLTTLFNHLKKNAPQYIPDVIMVDGNGILHPRGFGLASHLGVVLDIPTIGVAKTLITAQGISDDAAHKRKKQTLKEAGQAFDLVSSDSGNVIGKCVRVHDDAVNPIYVSIGHNISLSSAVWIVLETSKYRIPEPVRRADLDSREYIRQNKRRPEEFIMLKKSSPR